MMGGGTEGWHPNPEFFYQPGGGPMFDMGPYYLTAMVNLFGPIDRVAAFTDIKIPVREITHKEHGFAGGGPGPKFGKKFDVEVPDHHTGVIRFQGGVTGQLTTSFATPGERPRPPPADPGLRHRGHAARARPQQLRRHRPDQAGRRRRVPRPALRHPHRLRARRRPRRHGPGDRHRPRPPLLGSAGPARARRHGRLPGLRRKRGVRRDEQHGRPPRAAARGAAPRACSTTEP